MKSKRERAIELLRNSKERLEILIDHLDHLDLETPDDYAAAQADPRNYTAYQQYDFVVHQLDLSTEGLRQIRSMGQDDVLDAVSKYVNGNINDFIALHKHLFHIYDSIDTDQLWETITYDCPMMLEAIELAIEDLELESEQQTLSDFFDKKSKELNPMSIQTDGASWSEIEAKRRRPLDPKLATYKNVGEARTANESIEPSPGRIDIQNSEFELGD